MRPITLIRAVPIAACVAIASTLPLVGCGDQPSTPSVVAVADLYVVERTNFDMAIPASGELSAMRQIEVRNRLESRAVITEVVAEGVSVRQGDVVLRLAEEEMKDKIKDQRDKVNVANSELIAAEQTLAIRENTRASELEKADLAIEMAKLALLAWENGELVSQRQALALAKETAQIDLKRLNDRFEQSAKLVDKNFISRDEFERDRIAMIEAQAKSKQADLDQKVYEEYTYKQDRAKKESDVEQAIAERARVEQRENAEIVKAKSDLESAKFKVESAADRLKAFETQLGYCTVIAPTDGLVVYATSIDSGGGGRGGGDAQPPQVGTELRPNELVIILPDTTQMVANLKVSEALSGRIRIGQSVTVYSDALPNVPLKGSVLSVSVLAASGGWRDPNRRDYTVRVALEADPSLGLKPSMRCKAEILLDRVDNAIGVPIQAIFRQGPIAYIHVSDGTSYEQRLITLGRSSELRVEVVEGLKEGERVLLREPKSEEITTKLDFEALAAKFAPPSEAPREGGESAGEGPRVSQGGGQPAQAGQAGPRRGDGAGRRGRPEGQPGEAHAQGKDAAGKPAESTVETAKETSNEGTDGGQVAPANTDTPAAATPTEGEKSTEGVKKAS
jgi:multidrug resistance efflux pump